MAYTITKSDGSTLTTIADGLLDRTTSLSLPGPNYVGYGQILNENLVYLLENFAGNSAPTSNNLQGQLWFDKFHQNLKVFTSQGYISVSGISVGTVEPVAAQDGNIWFNTATNQMFMYSENSWNLIGPEYTKSQGVSGAVPVTISDQNAPHNVVQLQYGSTVLATLSSDNVFVPASPINGFSKIYPGLTINETLINGSAQFYANANAAAYLPSDPTIQSLHNNIAQVNSALLSNVLALGNAVTTANLGMLNYVNTQINSMNLALVSGISAAENSANTAISALQQNTNSQIANLQTVTSGIQANVTAANAVMVATTSSVNSNIAAHQTQINTLIAGAYTNANVANYLPVYGGNIAAASVTASAPAWPPAQAGAYDNQVATTTYVNSVLPRGAIIMWGGPIGNIPAGWQLCNGSNGTPDLRNQFVMGAGNNFGVGATGGAASVALSNINLPAHVHGLGSGATVIISGTTGSGKASLTDPGHFHGSQYDNRTPGSIDSNGAGDEIGGKGFNWTFPTTTATTGITDSGHTHSFSGTGSLSGNTNSAGSGTAFSTMPPFYALCYIQKMY
jgi:hypothetical protein